MHAFLRPRLVPSLQGVDSKSLPSTICRDLPRKTQTQCPRVERVGTQYMEPHLSSNLEATDDRSLVYPDAAKWNSEVGEKEILSLY